MRRILYENDSNRIYLGIEIDIDQKSATRILKLGGVQEELSSVDCRLLGMALLAAADALKGE